MSKNNKQFSFVSLMSSNKIVFLFSLAVAVVFWVILSMSQTTEIERVFTDVKVKINAEETLPKNSNLEIFGNSEFFVDVTVKGLSYLVNDSSFTSDNINITASCAAVSTSGTFDLPLTYTINGVSNNIQVVSLSSNSVKVNFDQRIKKSFALTEEIEELDGYSIAEGLVRENPRLSVDKVEISGPAREIAKISSIKAHVTLSEKLNSTLTKEADIIIESASGDIDKTIFTIENTEPIYVTIPVNKVGSYKTAVDFSSIPQDYRDAGIDYTVSPNEVDVAVLTGEGETKIDDDNKILIGTIDFSQINNSKNSIKISNDELLDTPTNFFVNIDMSEMSKRWIEISVDLSSVKIPDGITVVSKSVKSVQIVGPESSVMNIDQSAAYAVPVFDSTEFEPGTHTVSAKIILRTLTDSWVYGDYTLEISVK